MLGALVSCCVFDPSVRIVQISFEPPRSLVNAIVVPSGDHAGLRSADPLEWVMLRVSPFSTGIVNTSPRAST